MTSDSDMQARTGPACRMRAVGEGGVYRAFLVQAGAAAEQGGGGVGLAVPRRHVQRRPPLLPKGGGVP